MHSVYVSYLEGQTWPGAFWQNLFFLASITSQMVAFRVQDTAERKLMREVGEYRKRTLTESFHRKRKSIAGFMGKVRRSTVDGVRRGSAMLVANPKPRCSARLRKRMDSDTARGQAEEPNIQTLPQLPPHLAPGITHAHSSFSPTPCEMNGKV